MSKTKIVEKIVRFELFLTVIGQLWSIGRHSKTRFFQNWIIRNTHCHQTFDFYEIAELRKTWVSQFEAILRMIAQIVVFFRANCCFFRANCCFFFAQNWCARKEKFCVSFRKNCAKVLRMETLDMHKAIVEKFSFLEVI